MLGLLRKLTDTSSEIRREFGPRLHHHIPEAQRFSVGLFCARKASVGAIPGSRLRSVVLRVLPFWAGFRPISSHFYLFVSRALATPCLDVERVCGEVVGNGDC